MPGHSLQEVQGKIPVGDLKGFTDYLKNNELHSSYYCLWNSEGRERSKTGQLLKKVEMKIKVLSQ